MGEFCPKEHLGLSKDILGCHNLGRGGGHLAGDRAIGLHNRELSVQNVNSSEVEKEGFP